MATNTPPKRNMAARRPAKAARETNHCFFAVAVLAYYRREETLQQRHLNVILEVTDPQLTKKTLEVIQRSALQRLLAENQITPDMVQDIVILSLNPMGYMPPSQFHGTEEAEPATLN